MPVAVAAGETQGIFDDAPSEDGVGLVALGAGRGTVASLDEMVGVVAEFEADDSLPGERVSPDGGVLVGCHLVVAATPREESRVATAAVKQDPSSAISGRRIFPAVWRTCRGLLAFCPGEISLVEGGAGNRSRRTGCEPHRHGETPVAGGDTRRQYAPRPWPTTNALSAARRSRARRRSAAAGASSVVTSYGHLREANATGVGPVVVAQHGDATAVQPRRQFVVWLLRAERLAAVDRPAPVDNDGSGDEPVGGRLLQTVCTTRSRGDVAPRFRSDYCVYPRPRSAERSTGWGSTGRRTTVIWLARQLA